jgi:hypothetical protein
MMGVMKNRLRDFLKQESILAAPSGGGGGGGGLAALMTPSFAPSGSLSRTLVDDCVVNLEKSTQPGDGSEVEVFESLHPQFDRCDYVSEVKFEGAKALFVSFDPQCHIQEGALVFQTLRSGGVQLARYTTSDTFKPLVVHSDHVFFRFTASGSSATGAYGYRFEVSPMHGLQVGLSQVACHCMGAGLLLSAACIWLS